MKRIHLLSEIATAAGADLEKLTEFLDRECNADDSHNPFRPLEPPDTLERPAAWVLDEGGDLNGEELEVVSALAAEGRKVAAFMVAENIDFFHDDLVKWTESAIWRDDPTV